MSQAQQHITTTSIVLINTANCYVLHIIDVYNEISPYQYNVCKQLKAKRKQT